MTATKIEWTDRTWNPVTGCTKVSPGCDNCYAEGIARRFAGGAAFPNGFDVTLRPEKLDAPLHWRKPARVFVNSMSDLFHADVPNWFIADVFATMAAAPQHTFQVLTKRQGRMRSLLSAEDGNELIAACTTEERAGALYGAGWPLPNVWLGVSVEDQKRADLRIPALLETPAAVRFLSCEPLLGPVDLQEWLYHAPNLYTEFGVLCTCGSPMDSDENCLGPQLGWVIVGGESGPKARPMHPDWARTIRDYCDETGVPYFFKQWGEWGPTGAIGIGRAEPNRMFVGPPLDEYGQGEEIARIGKKGAGRQLDGRTHDEFPHTAVTA